MVTLPLYHRGARPDAWHDVSSPGGYEWWYFDAQDPEHDRQIVAILFDGFVFHPQYLRRHFRFARFPTHVRPALPREYLCAYLAIYHSGRLEHQFLTQYPAEQFAASADNVRVRIGPNQLSEEGQRLRLWLGGTPWKLTPLGPRLLTDTQLTAKLVFAPRFAHAAGEHEFFSRQLAGAEHRWIIADPLCDVSGEIHIVAERGADQTVPIRGVGYHDHNYGTGPIGPGLKRWFWGRLLLRDRCVTFHFARPRDWRSENEFHLFEIDASGSREIDIESERVSIDWTARTRLLLRYPERARFHDVLSLSSPRVLDSSPFYLRLSYRAEFRGESGEALCEVAYPHRLRFPILGRMIERSIDRRAMFNGRNS